jgi:hypothetical protein
MRRYLLWAALLLAVGSLAAIAWRLARGAHAQAGVTPGGATGASEGSGVASAAASDPGAGDANGQGERKG